MRLMFSQSRQGQTLRHRAQRRPVAVACCCCPKTGACTSAGTRRHQQSTHQVCPSGAQQQRRDELRRAVRAQSGSCSRSDLLACAPEHGDGGPIGQTGRQHRDGAQRSAVGLQAASSPCCALLTCRPPTAALLLTSQQPHLPAVGSQTAVFATTEMTAGTPAWPACPAIATHR